MFIPVAESAEASRWGVPSTTPLYETVHALMCQSLGNETFHSISTWFHEGAAEVYEARGVLKAHIRVSIRVKTWLDRHRLPEPARFCREVFEERNSEGKGVFYRTAGEFIRILEGMHGRAAMLLPWTTLETAWRSRRASAQGLAGHATNCTAPG